MLSCSRSFDGSAFGSLRSPLLRIGGDCVRLGLGVDVCLPFQAFDKERECRTSVSYGTQRFGVDLSFSRFCSSSVADERIGLSSSQNEFLFIRSLRSLFCLLRSVVYAGSLRSPAVARFARHAARGSLLFIANVGGLVCGYRHTLEVFSYKIFREEMV